MLNKIKYHIIGPRHNWVVTRLTLISFVSVLGLVFLLLAGVSTFQYFYYQYSFATLKDNYNKQKSRTQDLQSTHNDLQEKILTLQTDINKKNALINSLESPRQIANTTKKITKEENEQYQKDIKRFQKNFKYKELQIKSLERQQNQYQQKIQSLNNQIVGLEKNITTQQSSNHLKTSLSPETNQKQLVIEQLKLSTTNTNISIRFNLRNISLEVQSGHIGIIPLGKDQREEKIKFNNKMASSFLIKRFRSYSRVFKKQDYPSIATIRIMVWNQNKTLLLAQNFPAN